MANSSTPPANALNHQKRLMRRNTEQNITGYLMIAPNLISFLVFTVFGVAMSIALSFTNWDLVKGFANAEFVGLKNFITPFTDSYVKASVKNNIILLLGVPITLFLAILFATIFNRGVYGKMGARALFFLPYVTNVVAVATVWRALYHPSKGPINMLLHMLGIPMEALPGWIGSSKWAIWSIVLINIWSSLGYYVILYTGALQSIPNDLYEAAALDGAGAVAKFIHITIPQVAPTTFMLTILGVIGSLQSWAFMQIFSGPGTSTYTLGLYIYNCAFTQGRGGYACAMAWLLALVIFVFTVFRIQYENKYSAD